MPGRDARFILPALALLLLAVWLPPVKLTRTTHDAIVVFDITQSMDVEDHEIAGVPVSRLAYAREAARRALGELPCGSRVGWAAFAEYRTLLLLAPMEVCGNYGDLLASLELIDGRMRWANASQVSKGVFWAARVARELGTRPVVVFVTDGQEAPPMTTQELAPFDDLKPGETAGWLLGAGGDTLKPIPHTDDDGHRLGYWRADEVIQIDASRTRAAGEHLSNLREPHLKAIARQLGFEYARLGAAAVMKAAMSDPRAAHRRPVPTELNWLPALGALALLVLRFRPDGIAFRRPHVGQR